MATCKGRKKDGTPCRSPIVLDNGYCRAHQDQAAGAENLEEPVRWTRERLEAAITAHGGPKDLDISDADLPNLDLGGMDLHGIVLTRWDEEIRTWMGANLRGADLRAANLEKAELHHADLQQARLTDANLQGAKLWDADLRGAKLWHADLRGAKLQDADLRGASLVDAKLEGAFLREAKLQEANLTDAALREGDLRGAEVQQAVLLAAELQGADLSHARLQDADLRGAKLQAANLSHAKLQDADLREANLQGAFVVFAQLRGADLGGANLRGARVDANLQEANLWGANLSETSLQNTDLQGADLRYTNLQGADLRHVNLQGADLRFADLRGLDLSSVRRGGLRGVRLCGAKLDRTALTKYQLEPRIGDEQAGEYRQAREAYLALKQNFEDLGDYEAASWSYIKERQMEKACSAPRRARRFCGEEQLGDTSEHKLPAYHPRVWWFFVRHTAKWLGDSFVEALCGYGESIWRVLGWMAVLLFGSPLLFGLLRLLDWPDKNVETFYNLSVPWRHGYAYLQQFLYVLDAFTTADFAELQPANGLARLLSGCIALLGVFLTGILGFVAGNRIRRS